MEAGDEAMTTTGGYGQSTALARLVGVEKRYGPVTALQGVDLEVQRGEILGLLGPNGAGKSTAIAILLGLERADNGEASMFGRSPRDIAARRGIGVMMQEVVLPAELTVRELIAVTSAYYPLPLSLDQTVTLAGVERIATRRYGRLSGGQKRQAQFALAICGQPDLLFLDEPTTGLDVAARESMWATLRCLVAGGASVLLTTHYIEEAEALADRIVVLASGRCIANGTAAEMRALVARKQIACVSQLSVECIRNWPEVASVHRNGTRTLIGTAHAEPVVGRLLATDPGLSELEVHRASLAEAVGEIIDGAGRR
jgi:ABC-2 type transport system ATP-binding protein